MAEVDNVNNPQHYKGVEIQVECIDITRHMHFNDGNAFKYVWRAGKKDPSKLKEDLMKARWYLTDIIYSLDAHPDNWQSDKAATVLNFVFNHLNETGEYGKDQQRYDILTDIVYGEFKTAISGINKWLTDLEQK